MAKISLNNIIEGLSAKSGVTRKSSDHFMHAFVNTIEKGLQEDGIVKVKGLGTFKLQEVNDRGSVDVNTGERITIKGYRRVTFTPDSAMKEFVNRPFAHFEPTELNDGYPIEEESMTQEDSLDENEEIENDTVEEAAEEVVEAPVEEVVEEVFKEVVEEISEETTEIIVEDAVEEEEPEEAAEENVEEATIETIEKEEFVVETAENPAEEVSEVEKISEERSETADEPVEIVDEPASKEEDSIVEEPTTVEESVAVEDSAIVEVSQPTRERKKHRGGCLWIVLFLLIAFVGYFLITHGVIFDDGASGIGVEEEGSITVKPNLQEELDAEWSNESKSDTPNPEEKRETIVPATTGAELVVASQEQLLQPDTVENVQPTVSETSLPQASVTQTPEVVKPAMEVPFCAVTLTSSLAAKPLNTITLADTSDYTMSGTLVTHELEEGETIIQLARRYYGEKRLWPYIVKYNAMKDFNNVAVGQKINIPILK